MVVGWLLIRAASILFPTFEAPAWVMKAFIGVMLLGFPAALVLAWEFEMTPEGVKRAEDPDWDNLRGDPRFTKLCEGHPK